MLHIVHEISINFRAERGTKAAKLWSYYRWKTAQWAVHITGWSGAIFWNMRLCLVTLTDSKRVAQVCQHQLTATLDSCWHCMAYHIILFRSIRLFVVSLFIKRSEVLNVVFIARHIMLQNLQCANYEKLQVSRQNVFTSKRDSAQPHATRRRTTYNTYVEIQMETGWDFLVVGTGVEFPILDWTGVGSNWCGTSVEFWMGRCRVELGMGTGVEMRTVTSGGNF